MAEYLFLLNFQLQIYFVNLINDTEQVNTAETAKSGDFEVAASACHFCKLLLWKYKTLEELAGL